MNDKNDELSLMIILKKQALENLKYDRNHLKHSGHFMYYQD
jgi:hypothetical protein